MSTPAAPALPSVAPLLAALHRTGPRPALAWSGEEGRVELSGRVLATWVAKAVGHLDAELALAPGEAVVIDLPPHWKRLVLALAAWSLGAEVQVIDPAPGTGDPAPAPAPGGPRVLVAADPSSDRAEEADEVLAVAPVSLALRWEGELPPLVHDWVQEVRAHPDELAVPVPAWSGPAPSAPADSPDGPVVPRLLLAQDGLPDLPAALGAWLAGGGIVGPADRVDADAARAEGVTAHG